MWRYMSVILDFYFLGSKKLICLNEIDLNEKKFIGIFGDRI